MLTVLPYGKNLYPGLLIIKTLLLSALEIIVISPLLPDYVKERTMGLAGGYIHIATGLSATVFSFGLLQMAQSLDLAYVCWTAGAISLLISLYCLFFIVDTFAKSTRLKQSTLSHSAEQDSRSCWSKAFESISYSCRITRKRKYLIAVYLAGISQRVLDLSFIQIISVWVSKYVYHGDYHRTSRHSSITLGVSNIVVIPLGVLFGLSYDKCGEFFTLSVTFFCAGFPYIVLYFMSDFDSVLSLGLQIFATTFSILTNAMSSIMIGRHSPKEGVGKVYAFRSFVAGLFMVGFSYLSGWIMDQSFSKVTFLIVGGLALAQVGMFIGIRLCCKKIEDLHFGEEEEDWALLFSPQD